MYTAYYFNNSRLVMTSDLRDAQIPHAIDNLKAIAMKDSEDGLRVDLYHKGALSAHLRDGAQIIAKPGEIEVIGYEPLLDQVRVNWMNDRELAKFYSLEELESIAQNLQALSQFAPTEEEPDFSFPNEIPERFREVDNGKKQRYTIDTINPVISLGDIDDN